MKKPMYESYIEVGVEGLRKKLRDLKLKSLLGTEPCPELKLVFDECISYKANNSYYIASLDPGIGKSSSIIGYIKNWKNSGFEHGSSVMICLSRITEIDRYIDEAGLDVVDYAVFTSDRRLSAKGLGRHRSNDARVLFVTQQMLQAHPMKGSFADAEFLYYKGARRTFVIWDEAFVPALPIVINFNLLRSLFFDLSRKYKTLVEEIESISEAVTVLGVGAMVDIPSHVEAIVQGALASVAPGVLSEAKRALLGALGRVAGQTLMVTADRGGGRMLVGSVSRLPADFTPTIILDASARVKRTYDLMEAAGLPIKRLSPVVTDYRNLDIHVWQTPSGRSTMEDEPTKLLSFVEQVAKEINTRPGEKALIITHKALIDPVADRVDTLATNPRNVSYLHWGDHHGTNKYSDVQRVFVIGSQTYADSAYRGLHLVASGEHLDQSANDDLARWKASELQDNWLQAICRGNIRNIEYGICGRCTVHLITSKRADLTKLLSGVFPGANIYRWSPVVKELTGLSKVVADALLSSFSCSRVTSIGKKEIRRAAGISRTNALSKVLAKEEFQDFLVEARIGVGTREFHRARAV